RPPPRPTPAGYSARGRASPSPCRPTSSRAWPPCSPSTAAAAALRQRIRGAGLAARPARWPALRRTTPLALVTGGRLEGIDAVCRYLAALAQGYAATPGPAAEPPPAARLGKEP